MNSTMPKWMPINNLCTNVKIERIIHANKMIEHFPEQNKT